MKNKFSERLKELRKGLYMTQDDVANIVGLSKSSINMYERGEREPSIETLCKLSELFGVSIDYLLDNNNSAEQWKHLYYEADNARHEAWHKGYETCLKDMAYENKLEGKVKATTVLFVFSMACLVGAILRAFLK